MPKQLLILTDADGVDFACFADSWEILPRTGGILEIRYEGRITGTAVPWQYIGGISSYLWELECSESDEYDLDEIGCTEPEQQWIH